MITKRSRRRRPVEAGDPEMTEAPSAEEAAEAAHPGRPAGTTTGPAGELDGAALDAAILRAARQRPNRTVDLAPLADELGVDPSKIQLAVESLARRRMVVAPFIEPGTAGGATLTSVGNRWLIEYEGGRPSVTPVALKPATKRVRPDDEAARLPRSQVYGVARGS